MVLVVCTVLLKRSTKYFTRFLPHQNTRRTNIRFSTASLKSARTLIMCGAELGMHWAYSFDVFVHL